MRLADAVPVARLLSAMAGFLVAGVAVWALADANRLTYLDEPCDPYYVGLSTPRLTTPQWIGEAGVEAVVVLSIDDLSDTARYEQYLRPILERLKRIDGRAPVSVMTNRLQPDDPQLQAWIREGLSIETHTADHPCPCLTAKGVAVTKDTYDRCIDQIAQVPNQHPVGFRLPCCDSMNSGGPRFFAEVFNKTTPGGHFLRIESSVFSLPTPRDPVLPRSLFVDEEGKSRFEKYIPRDRGFVNYVEDYPYPYVIARLGWQIPCAFPSDWEAQAHHGTGNPLTVRDWIAGLDVTVLKQGIFTLVFHANDWIGNERMVEFVDRAATRCGTKIKFLNFAEVNARLTEHMLGGHPLRAANGQDNGVRILDLDGDGFMDVVIGTGATRRTRVWDDQKRAWRESAFPVDLVTLDRDGNRRDAGVRFGVLQENGFASLLVRNEDVSGVWHFDGNDWIQDPFGVRGLELNRPVWTARQGRDQGVRLRDVDGDGICELVVGNAQQQGILGWSAGEGWSRLPCRLPEGTAIVDAQGRDAGLRFVDVDVDGHADVVFSDATRFSVDLFVPNEGSWSRRVLHGLQAESDMVPPFVRADGTNNGPWFQFNHLYVQNEDTADREGQVVSRHFVDLLGDDRTPPPRAADASQASFDPLPGFRVELMAAEPMVLDPVDLGWGPDGKLWVVEYADYPLGGENRGIPCGRVRFLEDTTGDGRYDRSTLFLDRIHCPMGILPWRNGVIVTAAPEVFFAEDTDGDGRADRRETLFTGFGVGNHQHRVNHPRWGLDNWVHAANGDSGGTIVSPRTGETVEISGRDLRFRPDDGRVEPQSGQAQFGRVRDDWGNWFGCNNSVSAWHYVLDDHYLNRNPHVPSPSIRVDMPPDYFARPVGRVITHCDVALQPTLAWARPGRLTSVGGITVYRDDLFGPEFTDNLFYGDSVYNIVGRLIPRREGVVLRGDRGSAEQNREFLASHDVWYRSAALHTGPDGALWICDMHRFVIEHPEWIDDELEKTLDLRAGEDMGRIYRVYPVDRTPRPIPRLDQLDTSGLIAALDHPSGWQRDMAHQMLLWRDDRASVPLLESLVRHSDRPQARLHALCVLDGLRSLGPSVLLHALEDPHPEVRRHAVRLSEPLLNAHPELGAALAELSDDPAPQVQLQLAYSLGCWDDPRAGTLLGALAVRHAADPHLLAAVLSSAVGHVPAMVDVALGDPARAMERAELLAALARTAIGSGDQQAVGRLLETIAIRPSTGYARWQFDVLAQLLDDLNSAGIDLAASRGTEAIDGVFRRALEPLQAAAVERAMDEGADPAERVAAVGVLARSVADSQDAQDMLVDLLRPQVNVDVQLAVVKTVARLSFDWVPDVLLAGWNEHGPAVRREALDTLITRKAWSLALLEAAEGSAQLPAEIGTTRRELLVRHADPEVARRAELVLGKPITREEIEEKLHQFRSIATLAGDPLRGKELFVSATCADCHQVQGVGNAIATDLATLVDKSPGALLVATIDPNRAFEDKFVQYSVVTNDGRALSGMLLEETSNSLILADQTGNQHVLLRRDIDELISTARSHMPEGLELNKTPQQLADLFAFIASSSAAPREVEGNLPSVVRADQTGVLHLTAQTCEIHAPQITVGGDYLVWFYDGPNDHVAWTVDVASPAAYEVWIEWAQIDEYADNPIVIEVAGGSSRIETRLPSTGGWGAWGHRRFGTLQLSAGTHKILLYPHGPTATEVSDLRGVILIPEGR